MDIFNEIMEVVRRYPNFENYELQVEPALKISGLEIYPDRRKIYRDRREISLTEKEYDLLCFLVTNRGRVLTYDQIYRKAWGDYAQDIENNNTIGFHICNLREKLFSASPVTVNELYGGYVWRSSHVKHTITGSTATSEGSAGKNR